ncbi:MAG: Sua5/YciO/YrdC/YwlC family protein, partial [Thermoanaerobaculales bacterium]|nr:Sua5/YciO/YrdC/YwlC family protein [Thermoanaerobaculales bacterium]
MEQLPFIERADLDTAVAAALRILRSDGVILIPTETFYGLAGNPFSAVAVERVMALKGRPRRIPLPVLAADWRQVEDLVEVPEGFRGYLERSWPGPL